MKSNKKIFSFTSVLSRHIYTFIFFFATWPASLLVVTNLAVLIFLPCRPNRVDKGAGCGSPTVLGPVLVYRDPTSKAAGQSRSNRKVNNSKDWNCPPENSNVSRKAFPSGFYFKCWRYTNVRCRCRIVHIADVDTGRELMKLSGHQSPVTAVEVIRVVFRFAATRPKHSRARCQ